MLRNIPKASIINLLSNITVSKYSARFDVRQLTEYLSSLSDQAIELWDVAFMDGSNKELTSLKEKLL